MRQAGRWDPEFNRLREGLSFYQFSEDVELAARASLLPRRFGVDGIILFYDVTALAGGLSPGQALRLLSRGVRPLRAPLLPTGRASRRCTSARLRTGRSGTGPCAGRSVKGRPIATASVVMS